MTSFHYEIFCLQLERFIPIFHFSSQNYILTWRFEIYIDIRKYCFKMSTFYLPLLKFHLEITTFELDISMLLSKFIIPFNLQIWELFNIRSVLVLILPDRTF